MDLFGNLFLICWGVVFIGCFWWAVLSMFANQSFRPRDLVWWLEPVVGATNLIAGLWVIMLAGKELM